MKIIHKSEALHVEKPEGLSVDYYLRPEYELHFDIQAPKTKQIWHHHEKIFESIFLLEGELTAEWKDADGSIQHCKVCVGDLIETENTPHCFTNHTDQRVVFLVIKQVPSGIDRSRMLKNDKVLDEPLDHSMNS